MHADPLIAFQAEPSRAGLEIRVNFGMFAGREATRAELDELAAALVPHVGKVSIIGETRHEVDDRSESSVHQVRIEVAPEHVPADAGDRIELTERLLNAAEAWATARIAERHLEA